MLGGGGMRGCVLLVAAVSLIELHPDVTRLTRAAERIAFTLEQIALRAYGVAPLPAKTIVAPTPTDERDISYASDEGTLRQELEALVMPQTVREREGTVVEEEVGNILGKNS